MYVVPYIMGPVNSPISKTGVEVTDSLTLSPYAHHVAYGQVALDRIGSSSDFVPGLHSIGDLDPMRRYIAHFPRKD